MGPNTKFNKTVAVPDDARLDPSSLKGKSVVITGGASGIGEATMRAFVQAGAYVTFGDVSEERGQKLVKELGQDNVAFAKCNVLEWDDQLQLFKTALEKSPSKTIDIVHANAGISGQDDIFNQSETEEPIKPDLAILETNTIGVAYTAKLANFYFPKQPQGDDRDRLLVITASLGGYMDMPGSPQYNASKWAVRGMMRSLRRTAPWIGARVNLIAPWFIGTRILSDDVQKHILGSGVNFAEVEDAASAVLHFASDKTINGRGFIVVPREFSDRGYYDFLRDDFEPEDPTTPWQDLAMSLLHRVKTPQKQNGENGQNGQNGH